VRGPDRLRDRSRRLRAQRRSAPDDAELFHRSRPKDCEIDWYDRSDALPEPYGDLGEIYVGSADVPAKCGEQVVRERLREAACKAGADAAVMLIVRKPDLLSFCYRMRARLLKYGEFAPAVLLPSLKREVWSSDTGLPRGLRGHH
jgi:hypothetical protein